MSLSSPAPVDPATATALWELLPHLESLNQASDGLMPAPAQDLQAAVDAVQMASIALASLDAAPAAGGYVAQLVLNRVAGVAADVIGTVFAASAVLALADLAGRTEPTERHRLLVHALAARPLPEGWTPPPLPVRAPELPVPRSRFAEIRAVLSELRQGLDTLQLLAALAPDESTRSSRMLGRIPVVGVVGKLAESRDTTHAVLRRATAECSLPTPNVPSTRELLALVRSIAAEAAREQLRAVTRRGETPRA